MLVPVALSTALFAAPQQPQTPPLEQSTGLYAKHDGAFGADGRNYIADFDGRGATLHVADPVVDAMLDLSLRLTDWGRGGAPRQQVANVHVPHRAQREVVQFEHVGVTERYRVGATSFEQSFVLHERPAGHGDLVLGIEVLADQLQAAAKAAAHQALVFERDGVPAVRYGEAVAFSRGAPSERVPVRTRYDGAGRIELIVPAELIDTATFPLVVDPAVGAVANPGGTSSTDSNSDVAFDPVNDRYLVVWERYLSTFSRGIRAQLYDADGVAIGGVLSVDSGFANQSPTVTYVGKENGFNGFLIAWAGAGNIRGRVLDSASGTFVFPAQTMVSSAHTDARPTLSSVGLSSELAWDRTLSGETEPTQILTATVNSVDGSSTGFSVLSSKLIEAVPSGFVPRPRFARTRLVDDPILALHQLVWERFFDSPAPGDYDVRTAAYRLVPYSIFLGPSSVPGASSIGVSERLPDIACLGDAAQTTLIAWEDTGDVRGIRYENFAVAGSAFDIRATSERETAPAVGAGSTEFSVGYMSAPNNSASETDVYAARIAANGSILVADSAIEVVNGPLQTDLRVSSVPVFATDAVNTPNGAMFSWTLESSTGGVIADIRARRYEPIAGQYYPFGAACPGPFGELPKITVNSTPHPGNLGFQIGLEDAPPFSLSVLLIGDQYATVPVPGAPGCNLYMGLPFVNVFATISEFDGTSSVDIPIPLQVPPGAFLATQWGIYTPGWNAFGWITSDDMDLSWF